MDTMTALDEAKAKLRYMSYEDYPHEGTLPTEDAEAILTELAEKMQAEIEALNTRYAMQLGISQAVGAELFEANEKLEAAERKVAELQPLSIVLCDKHGGMGFVQDCPRCHPKRTDISHGEVKG